MSKNSPVFVPSREIANAIKDLPNDKKQVIVRAFASKQELYSGPLPDGESIRIYDEVIPNGGDRLMKTVEKQVDHRIKVETTSVKRSYNQRLIGQIMAFIIAMAFGAAAWHLALNNHDVAASILGGIDLVALVTVFITGRPSK